MLEVVQFPCLEDNIGVLLHDSASGVTASIDAPDAAAIKSALTKHGWRLTHILTTHHHGDHTGANLPLKTVTGCTIVGPAAEANRIPGLDRAVSQGDVFELGGVEVHVLETPGHTAGHVAYWLPSEKLAFTGDTLFAMGCGRIFEGTPETMWASLQKIAALPPDTSFYCGHEYTAANARFALSIEPKNTALQVRAAEVEAVRRRGVSTLPSRIDLEWATNPFLRADEPAIRERLGFKREPAWQVFAKMRELKNRG